MPKKNKYFYSVGSYSRLSKDDFHDTSKGNQAFPSSSNESNSISGQRQLIQDYASSRMDLRIVKEYEDDGYTGLNFDRPGFQAMLKDAYAGVIDCIIVKDFSRLGRDYIETGKYLKKIFPRLNVRFIAINDDYDSHGERRQSDNIIMPFKNLMNDNYSRDISTKVRSHLEIKQKNGEFTGSFAVYGYQKERQGRSNRLVPDEYAAAVVTEIFGMVLKGYSLQGVANVLNNDGILSPMEYKKHMGSRYSTAFKVNDQVKWSPVAVRRIITNEVYTGTLEQGKTEKINYKRKERVPISKGQRRRVEGAHEPLISKELFAVVQDLLAKDTRRSPKEKSLYPLSGLLQCYDCGQTMVRKTEKHQGKTYVYYVCSRNKTHKDQCSSHRVNEEKLMINIRSVLERYILLLNEVDEILPQIEKQSINGKGIEKIQKDLEIIVKEEEQKSVLKMQLYEDYKKGFLDETDYKDMAAACSVQLKELKTHKERAQEKIKKMHEEEHNFDWIQEIRKLSDEAFLERQYLITVIKQIYVCKDGTLKIELRHQDMLEAIVACYDDQLDVRDECQMGGVHIG